MMLPWIIAGAVVAAGLVGYACGALLTALFGASTALKIARAHPDWREHDLVWWSDSEDEYADPEIYISSSAAQHQAVADFKSANFPELQDADLTWEPETDCECGPLELLAAGNRTGIVVRPLTVRAAGKAAV